MLVIKQIIVNLEKTRYYITEDGKCYNSETKKYLKGQISNSGYLNYNLTLKDKKQRFYAHILVATYYLENDDPKNKIQVNHINGKKLDNNYKNLEWVTPKENINHAVENDLIKSKIIYCFNDNKELVATYKNIKVLKEKLNISSVEEIKRECLKNEKIKTKGYYWSYKNDNNFKIKTIKHGSVKKPVYQYDLEGNFLNEYESVADACRKLGFPPSSHLGQCCNGKLKTYKGYIWKFKEDIVNDIV